LYKINTERGTTLGILNIRENIQGAELLGVFADWGEKRKGTAGKAAKLCKRRNLQNPELPKVAGGKGPNTGTYLSCWP